MRKVWLYLLVVKESSFADKTFPPCQKLQWHLTKLWVRICLPTFICCVFDDLSSIFRRSEGPNQVKNCFQKVLVFETFSLMN